MVLLVSGCATTDPIALAVIDGLPPDPGDAGKETVAGIDADNDGVRDDIQRWIMLTYPDDQNTQQALFQSAKVKQRSLTEAYSKSSVREIFEKSFKASECIWSLHSYGAISIQKELSLIFYNTYDRTYAWNKHMGLLSGMSIKSNTSGIKACEFEVIKQSPTISNKRGKDE